MLLSADLRLILAAFGLVLIAAISHTALAQEIDELIVTAQVDATCTLTGGTLPFGTYTAAATSPSDSDVGISYTCTQGTDISLSLGTGGATGENRAMTGPGGATLPYELYQDAARTQVWADGASAVTVTDTSGSQETVTVYGRIPTGQQAPAGAYTDTVQITLVINP